MSLHDLGLRDSPSRSVASGAGDHRPDIQGLRAVAVGLVVLFHLWPARLRGGYVGVDVFFVISGYLITAHLMREVDETGTVRVVRFWARRIRRLLPASLLVLAVSGVAAWSLLPSTAWSQNSREVIASALYVQNWQLGFAAVDYLAADNEPTVAQHYWSLSVEEQFYAVWPLLILVLILGGAAAHERAWRRGRVLAGLAVVAAASFTWSIVSTPQDQGFAYFSTLTRAWEFAAGAIVGVLGRSLPRRLHLAAGWAGVLLMVGAGLTLSGSTAFPGWVALAPVLGAVLVLLSAPAGRFSAGALLSTRPLTVVGDLSYSVYLVHWPLIILTPALLGGELRWPAKCAVLAATLVLAWLSKTYVEDPLRSGPLLGRRPRRAYVFALAGMSVVTLGMLALPRPQSAAAYSAAAVAERIGRPAPCTGPLSLLDGCRPVEGSGPLLVPPEAVSAQKGPGPDCQTSLDSSQLARCEVGDPRGPSGTVALVGDSHAGAWVPTLDALGRARGWKVVVRTKASCPYSLARRVLPAETSDRRARACETVNDALVRALQAEKPRLLFVGQRAGVYGWTSRPDRPLREPAVDGLVEAWRAAGLAPGAVVVLRAVPDPALATAVPTCVATHADRLSQCSAPRSLALPPDDQVAAAARIPTVARVVDLTPAFCTPDRCLSVVGGVIVYRDRSHLSDAYARLLAPVLDQALAKEGR